MWCVQILRWLCSNLVKVLLSTWYLLLALHILFNPSRPTCCCRFPGSLYFSPPSYCPPISNSSSLYHLSILHLIPTSSPGAKRHPPGRRSHPPPDILRRLTLIPAPCACVCRRFLCPFVPLFTASSCAQVPVISWWVHLFWVPRIPCASALPYLCSAPTPFILCFLVSCWVAIFARGRDSREPPLPVNRSPRSSSPC